MTWASYFKTAAVLVEVVADCTEEGLPVLPILGPIAAARADELLRDGRQLLSLGLVPKIPCGHLPGSLHEAIGSERLLELTLELLHVVQHRVPGGEGTSQGVLRGQEDCSQVLGECEGGRDILLEGLVVEVDLSLIHI